MPMCDNARPFCFLLRFVFAFDHIIRAGKYNPKKLVGVTTLDVCRANTFVANSQGWDPNDTNVTVIGGHAGITILPLFSRVPNAKFSDEELEAITVRTREYMKICVHCN